MILAREVARDLDRPVELLSFGLTGARTSDLAGQLDKCLAQKPDITVILIGANDLRDMFSVLNTILGFYANCAMAWVVTVATDIVINKGLLKISPTVPEFRRGML